MKNKILNSKNEVVYALKDKDKIVIVGIGNILRADDGFGPALIENIKGKVRAVCLDAGTAPENYAGKIAKENPDVILIVDAVHLNLEAGAYCLLKKSEIVKCGFTTHDTSPHMFIEFLENQTKADIFLLGVQPQRVDFGQDITPKVKQTLLEITNLLKEVRNA